MSALGGLAPKYTQEMSTQETTRIPSIFLKIEKDYIGYEPILAPKNYYQMFGKYLE